MQDRDLYQRILGIETPWYVESVEETLTVHRLHVPQQLRLTLASTNVIESAFSVVEKVCSNVKRWHDGISGNAGSALACWWLNASSAK